MGEQAKNTLHENAVGWGILLIVLGVLAWLFWLYFDTEVRNIIRWIRFAEMWTVSWLIDDQHSIGYMGRQYNWQQGFEAVQKIDMEKLNKTYMSYFNVLALSPLKYIFIGFLLLGALWTIFNGPGTHYRSSLGIEGLIHRQKKNFPVISPFAKFDPSTQPPRPPGSPVPADLPLFAEALGPEEWLAYNKIPAPDGQLDEKATEKAFRKQLIGRWKGYKALKPYQQVLLAAFCLKASRKRNEADKMLADLATCWTFKKGLQLDSKLLSQARAVLKNKKLSSVVLSKANQHAFVTTAMLRALNTAREEGGVSAPAQFVWLRAHDRTLWYPMNNLGRQSFHMEAFGAMSHYRAEKMTQRPIPVPKIEDAVTAITEYMASGKARPIPQLDYSNSKKRGVKKAV